MPNIDVAKATKTAMTALRQAVDLCDPPLLKQLIDQGAEPNYLDSWGGIPRSAAERRANPEIMELLKETP